MALGCIYAANLDYYSDNNFLFLLKALMYMIKAGELQVQVIFMQKEEQ